ncbi:STAS domain-containing protein [Streptomyces canus]|uniref:STAS domain-containing protein n=1 Tax=Streptomyces canus TaxID=58343 RepID=UPI0030E4485B
MNSLRHVGRWARHSASAGSRPQAFRSGGGCDGAVEKSKGLLSRGVRFVVLDLSAVSFCDSAGLNVLIGAWRQADAGGVVLALACVPEPVRRILQMTGADQVLRVYGTVADAEAAFGG